MPGKVLDIDKRLLLEKGSDFETLSETPKRPTQPHLAFAPNPTLPPLASFVPPLPFTARPLSLPPKDAQQVKQLVPPRVWPFAAHQLPLLSLQLTLTRPFLKTLNHNNNNKCKTTLPNGPTNLPILPLPTSS